MLVKTTVKQPDNTIEESTYKYSPEVGNLYLKNKNIVGIPLEDKVVKKTDVNDPGKVILVSKSVFPTSQSEADTKTSGLPLPYSLLSTDLQNITKEEVSYDKYDNKGNLQQYTNKDGISTTIIWGYNQTKPIAKIEGAKFADISSSLVTDIVDASNLDNSAAPLSDESSFFVNLDNFRKDSSLANYLVTTYTYDPLIGVRSITPPSGMREIYKYDSAGRIERVVDVNGKIIKEYNYNYAPIRYYNKAISQTLTKNNCPNPGMIGTSYTYSVPANQYTSLINQVDADQQAQNDINTNGQNVANENCTCYYPYCEFNAQASSGYINMQYAPFQKVNTLVNAQLNFQVTSLQGLNWSDGVQLGNIPSPCWPIATVTRSSGNWQVTIFPGSGQTVLRWIGSGSPSTGGTPYNISFNYNVN
ncbi:DUF5977 domain-containing protein [Chryseobacterium wanjuense]